MEHPSEPRCVAVIASRTANATHVCYITPTPPVVDLYFQCSSPSFVSHPQVSAVYPNGLSETLKVSPTFVVYYCKSLVARASPHSAGDSNCLSETPPYLFAMKNITPLLVSSAACVAAAYAQTTPSESGYHYTPAWSSWAPVTIYTTITESTTIYTPLPTTIYVTLSSTTTTSTTATATTTTTTERDVTIIESFTTTKPVTATEIIEEIITSEVEPLTITLCTSRDTNPTYTAAIIPLPSDYTWGCPPGYLCKPVQEDCNFEVGLPSEGYYCAPDECIAVTPLPTPQLWNPNIYGNASPATDPNLKFNVVDHYFNMNPRDYGLSYDIFAGTEVITYTSTTTILEAPTQAVRARQAQTSVPAACYPWCNNCLLEAQAVGKTPALCVPGSPFEIDVNDCEQCIAYHKSDSTGSFVQIAPQFQQFINYCAQISSTTVVSTPTSTHTNTPIPVVQTSSVRRPPSSSSTVTATLTVAGPTTATIGAQSTPITSTTPSTWTTTLTLTLSGPTNISISAYTPDTTHYKTSTLTSTMTLEGPTTITFTDGSPLPTSQVSSSKAIGAESSTSSTTAPPTTFSGSAVPAIRPSGIWTSIFSVIGSMLACAFWI